MFSFPSLEPVHCSMSGSNCCFLTCVQISQEADKVVWYSHLGKFLRISLPTNISLTWNSECKLTNLFLALPRWCMWERTHLSMEETRVQSLGQEDPLEGGTTTHSSVLAWRIPWTEEPGRLQSVGPHRVRHDWSDLHTICYLHVDCLFRFWVKL